MFQKLRLIDTMNRGNEEERESKRIVRDFKEKINDSECPH
jgi:hypothetical protein